jgi:hypothetical protein
MTREEWDLFHSEDRRLSAYRTKQKFENFQVGLSAEQHAALVEIKQRTRVPMSALVREAIDVVIERHAKSSV